MSRTFFQRYGFDINIVIGTYLIDTTLQAWENGLTGDFTCSARCGQARTLSFSIIPPTGIIDPGYFQGQEVRCTLRGPTGSYQPIFTGWVDVPIVDLHLGRITFQCTDRRNDRILQSGAELTSAIGYYSTSVFGTTTDSSQELEKRLQTIPYDFDYDNNGLPTLTSWSPKSSPDFTLGNSDIFYPNISISYTNRTKTINTINITVDYSYQRLHQQVINYTWPGYDNFLSDWWNIGRPSFPTRSTIQSAAGGSEWKLNGVEFDPLWPAQGFPYNGGVIIWQPNQVSTMYTQRTTANSTIVPGLVNNEPVTDLTGNPAMDISSITVTDTSSNLCKGAAWSNVLRFAQTIKETYNLSVAASQSIEKFGAIQSFEQVQIVDAYDSSQWVNATADAFDQTIPFIDQKNIYDELNNSLITSLNKAKTQLLNLHRDVLVTFSTPRPWPNVDLKYTIELIVDDSIRNGTASIHTKARVNAFTHKINFITETAQTEVELVLSRAQGSSSTDSFIINRPSVIGDDSNIVNLGSLGTTIGRDAANDGVTTGWIANAFVNTNNTLSHKTTFQEAFIVKFPAIPSNLRDELATSVNNNYNTAIPNDLLEVTL